MKKLFVLSVAAALLYSCNNEKNDAGALSNSSSNNAKMDNKESKEARNKQTILASLKAYEQGDVNTTLKDADKDIVDYGDGTTKPVKGLDSIRAGMGKWFPLYKTAFPDAKMQIMSVAADSNYVMVWSENSGTWKGNYMGQKPTGKSFKMQDVDVFKFNDAGKITEHRTVQSHYEFNRQTGMKESMP